MPELEFVPSTRKSRARRAAAEAAVSHQIQDLVGIGDLADDALQQLLKLSKAWTDGPGHSV